MEVGPQFNMNDFYKYTILEDDNIKNALLKLKVNGEKTLVVISKTNKLKGTLSDGDVRTAFLNNLNLNSKIKKILKKECIYFYDQEYTLSTLKKIFLESKIGLIPIIDGKKNIVKIVSWDNIFVNKYKIKKLDAKIVIMAGGKGSRLEPFTEILPKPLIPVNNRTIIEIIIEKFKEHNINQFYISVNYKFEIIKAYLKETNLKCKINYLTEKKQLGTAGPLSLLPKHINKTIVVSNCDITIDEDYSEIYDYHKSKKHDLTLVITNKKTILPYGNCIIDKKGNLKKIIEKPENNYFINTGFYFLEPKVIKLIPKNVNYNFNELINDLIKKKYKIGVFPIQNQNWKDVGQWSEYLDFLKKNNLSNEI